MSVIKGTAFDDVLKGTIYGDIISGGRGDDTILDRGGRFIASDDFFFGGQGDDFIQSLSGNDKMFGGRGDDAFQLSLVCDPHNDGFNRLIRGGTGLDELVLVDPENIQHVQKVGDHIEIYDKSGGITSVYNVEHFSFDF
jgi:Ca2+-binding RTX toxin-like protein